MAFNLVDFVTKVAIVAVGVFVGYVVYDGYKKYSPVQV